MLDLLIRGARVVDGTGAPAFAGRRRRARRPRSSRLGDVDRRSGPAHRSTPTASCVAPGFVDIHTHYDVQALWDPALTPSPLHGVTTVIGGNCGFSIAPLAPGHVDYVMQMMARVEGMPIDALRGRPRLGLGERSASGSIALDGRLAVNAGFHVGHSTMRRVVDGRRRHPRRRHSRADRGDGRPAARVARAPARSGSRRRSATRTPTATARRCRRAPRSPTSSSRWRGAVRDHAGTSLEFIPAMGEITDERIELMADMSLAADRPLNWNLLGSAVAPPRSTSSSSRRPTTPPLTARRSSRSRCPTSCASAAAGCSPRCRAGVRSSRCPTPNGAPRSPIPRCANASRAGLDAAARTGVAGMMQWDLVELPDGRSVASVAAERGTDAVDVLLDVVRARRAPAHHRSSRRSCPPMGVTDESWEVRGEVWRDERVVLGGSDAGAHVDLMCHANYPSVVLGELVRRARPVHARGGRAPDDRRPRRALRPARPRRDRRGRARRSRCCSTPSTIDSEPAEERHDLPGGALRLYAGAVGVEQVDRRRRDHRRAGWCSPARMPGTLLRSGVDTDTVTVPGNR